MASLLAALNLKSAMDSDLRRNLWMRQGAASMAAQDWVGAIRAYAQGLIAQPPLAHHYASSLERARRRWRDERSARNNNNPADTHVVIAAGELSHNAAGRAHTLLLTYQHLGNSVRLLGCHFPAWGQELWEPIRKEFQRKQIPVNTFVVHDEAQFFRQAWVLVLQHPADLVHLSKPRLPAVVFGLLYKLLWGAAVLMDIDDEELYFVGAREPISVEALKLADGKLPPAEQLMGPLWTRLAVDLSQRFDGITVANKVLQQRYGGTVIPHGRDPVQLRPITASERSLARQCYGIQKQAKVVLFFGTPRRHKGLLEVATAVAALPENLNPLFVIAGGIPDAALERDLLKLLPPQRLRLLGNQPFERARDILALADLEVLLNSGDVATYQSPAKLSDALAVGLPVLVSEAAPLQEAIARGWAVRAEPERLTQQLLHWLNDVEGLTRQGKCARDGFLEALSLPVAAESLRACMAQALAAPKSVDGQQLTVLESLAPELASPLMAQRYSHWSERRINWPALRQSERDPVLVSVVVPVYGDPAELDGCLQALRQAATSIAWEVVAVMNDASTESQAVLTAHQQADRRIRAVWPGENVQFALGCNLGFAASRGERLVFLNNDCRVDAGWLEALLAPLADAGVAATQPRLLKPDGTVQCLGVVFRDRQTLGYPLYNGLDGELSCCRHDHQLQAVTGACLALRAGDFAAVRGFDASFINGQEDVDLCLRLLELPDRQVCVSTTATSIVHSESVAPGRFRHTRWSRMCFVQRWWGQIQPDDLAIYRRDGLEVVEWREDAREYCRDGIGAGRPSLRLIHGRPRVAIVIHVFYLDLWPEIKSYLSILPAEMDVHITCCSENYDQVSAAVKSDVPNAEFHLLPNEGMDVLPFLRLIPELKKRGYGLVCKLHTKRGCGPHGAIWRHHLLRNLVGDQRMIHGALKAFEGNPELALAGPADLYMSGEFLMYNNRPKLEAIHRQLETGRPFPEDWGFFAGSMFWARINAIAPIADAADRIAIAYRNDSQHAVNGDGGLAHALERAIGWASRDRTVALLRSEINPSSSGCVATIASGNDLSHHVRRMHVSSVLKQLSHTREN